MNVFRGRTGLPVIVKDLRKSYRVMKHRPGLKGVFRDFTNREYVTKEAVKGISFSIKPGEIVGFIGPNGAGKTTTLKILSGLLVPTSGFVKVGSHIPSLREREFLCSVGAVMGKRSQLWWDLDAYNAVHMVAAAYGVPEQSFRDRFHSMSALLGVKDLRDQPVRNLSLGERMKFELIASLIHGPGVLFLDEPTLGLDLMSQRNLRKFVVDCNEEYGTTVLLTSHYLADIESVCSRTLIIRQGLLAYDGELDSLRHLTAGKRVRIQGSGDARVFRELGLEWNRAKSEWEGVLAPLGLASLLRIAGEMGDVNLTVEDPPLEDVIALIYEGGEVREVLR